MEYDRIMEQAEINRNGEYTIDNVVVNILPLGSLKILGVRYRRTYEEKVIHEARPIGAEVYVTSSFLEMSTVRKERNSYEDMDFYAVQYFSFRNKESRAKVDSIGRILKEAKVGCDGKYTIDNIVIDLWPIEPLKITTLKRMNIKRPDHVDESYERMDYSIIKHKEPEYAKDNAEVYVKSESNVNKWKYPVFLDKDLNVYFIGVQYFSFGNERSREKIKSAKCKHPDEKQHVTGYSWPMLFSFCEDCGKRYQRPWTNEEKEKEYRPL